jgi:hypothetical protein
MSNQPFRPTPIDHEIEVLHEGKTYKGHYHLEKDNVVVSYQGASKMATQDGDDATLARTILEQIVIAKQRH